MIHLKTSSSKSARNGSKRKPGKGLAWKSTRRVRKPILGEPINLLVPLSAHEYQALNGLLETGLFGRSIMEVAERLLSESIQRHLLAAR